MGVGRESPVASEGDRDERSRIEDFVAPFQARYPPVAMSLRTRESSSLALKQIFDQINASAENPQSVNSLLGSGVAVLEKRDDDGKRDGLGVSKEVPGTIRAGTPDLDTRQRAGGVPFPRNQGFGEERTSHRFKSFDGRVEAPTGQQQVNRGPAPQGFVERAHCKPQFVSEKDSRVGFRMPERAVASRFQDAGGNGDYIHNVPQEEAANVSPLTLPQDLHVRKRLPELDISFRKSQNQETSSFSPAETAFGSPISAPSHRSPMDNVGLPNSAATSWSVHSMQQGPLPQAAARSSSANTLNRKPTAQLTIFYSGMVNVYDDVPADKANAIMLLAGNGNSWSTGSTTPRASPLERDTGPQDIPPSATQSPVAVSANVGLGAAITGITSAKSPAVMNGIAPAKTFSPPVAANSSLCPSNAPTPIVAGSSSQTPAKRSHTGIELPHARKASLARFLEKRKDRVQVKPQGGNDVQDDEKLDLGSPGSPKKQRAARSRSPSPTRSAPCSREDNSTPIGQPSLPASASRRFME